MLLTRYHSLTNQRLCGGLYLVSMVVSTICFAAGEPVITENDYLSHVKLISHLRYDNIDANI